MANRLVYVANITMWPMWLIAEKSHLQLSGSPKLSKRTNAYWLLVQSEFDGCPGPVVATGCSVTL